ncbi:hypothetical protein [Streptomyces sp. NPDC050560]|uniref:hypothetical protein n=1 Tax=Streptomyces sp. NPDC050560 TaxID=3365630 RepID=UPI003791D9F4
MANTLTFILQGRDDLSRSLNGAGDSADRLRARLNNMSNDTSRQLAGFTRDADGRFRDLQGRFITTDEAARRLNDGITRLRAPFADLSNHARHFGDELRSSWISLIPAAIPLGAGLAGAAAAVAAQLGAGATAAVAYGLALGPQITAIGNVIKAQDAYDDAVQTSGRTSQEAAQAQAEVQRQLATLPPATQRAAVAVGLLSDNFHDWSDSLSGDVMGPFVKGVGVANALLPKTTGYAIAASGQFDRLVTMLGGAIETPGFDKANARFQDFSEKTLRDGVDGLTEFFAKVQRGDFDNSGIERFFDYAHAQGPAVASVLHNVGDATFHLLDGASGVGVGMLDLINALSGIVAAVPPQGIAALLQMAIAIKAVKLAAAGGKVVGSTLAAIATQIGVMRTASTGTPGRIAGVTAAIGGLSRGAKVAAAGTGIGLLVIALSQLSGVGKSAPPDVDKLTTSLGKLAETGKASGEAARVFGSDFGDLADSLGTLARPSTLDNIQQGLTKIIGMDSTPVKDAKERFDGLDKALAGLVSEGKGDLAASALDQVIKQMAKQGFTADEVRGQLDDYKDALAGQRLEQQLAAQSMGLFGDQAIAVQQKLDAQKASADGLRQSIVALNDVNRSALSAQADLEQAIDDTAKAARTNGDALHYTGGELDLGSQKARDAYRALNDLASKTDAATTAARDQGRSWDYISSQYDKGRNAMIRSAMQMGLNRTEAARLADQILKTPNKTAYVKGDLADLKAKLADAKSRLKSVPDSRKAQVRAEIASLQKKIAQARSALASLHDRTIQINAHMFITGSGAARAAVSKSGAGRIFEYAGGGLIGGPSPGGLIQGPGTSTSDSIPIWASNNEYMVKAAAVAKYGVKFMDDLNAGRVPLGRPAAGRAAASASSAAAAAGTAVTYNVYPRASVISASDLQLITRQEEARQRVGRPR